MSLAGCPPRSAAEVLDGSQYFVLLIITDGVISDMAQTKEAIVNVSPGVPRISGCRDQPGLGSAEPSGVQHPTMGAGSRWRCGVSRDVGVQEPAGTWGAVSCWVAITSWGPPGCQGALARWGLGCPGQGIWWQNTKFGAFFPPQAAKLPMSIIIVGVGQAEFDGKAGPKLGSKPSDGAGGIPVSPLPTWLSSPCVPGGPGAAWGDTGEIQAEFVGAQRDLL